MGIYHNNEPFHGPIDSSEDYHELPTCGICNNSIREALERIKQLASADPSYANAIKIELLAGNLLSGISPSSASLDAWKQIPKAYQGKLSYDYNEKTRMFDITHNGYGVAQSEDSEVAHAICVIVNALLHTEEPRSNSITVICARWKKLDDGCVARCDKSAGHKGEHLDGVIDIQWHTEEPK